MMLQGMLIAQSARAACQAWIKLNATPVFPVWVPAAKEIWIRWVVAEVAAAVVVAVSIAMARAMIPLAAARIAIVISKTATAAVNMVMVAAAVVVSMAVVAVAADVMAAADNKSLPTYPPMNSLIRG